MAKEKNLSEILMHIGEQRENYFNAISPPIIQSSNFAFPTLDAFRGAFADEMNTHIYTRGNNPTVKILREKVAALEHAEDALVFASGSGAIANAIVANVKAGDHIICVSSPYSWTKNLLVNWMPRFDISHTFVDGTDVANIEAAIQDNTTFLMLESPNSLTYQIQDLKACAELAKKHGITTAIDNSYASPLYQKPLDYGIDIVMHSGTKYLNGHSDVCVGVVCSNAMMIEKIFYNEYMTFGGIISPSDANLVIRGLRTLELRMERSSASAFKIAQYLEAHPKIEKVLHPHLPSFPQYELAKAQMVNCGGLFSIFVKSESIEEMEVIVGKIKRFTMAVSWGGHESLMIPTVTFYNIPGRENSPLPFTMIRLYIGLEDPDWLIEDLAQALG